MSEPGPQLAEDLVNAEQLTQQAADHQHDQRPKQHVNAH
jgi:hypothetical protein